MIHVLCMKVQGRVNALSVDFACQVAIKNTHVEKHPHPHRSHSRHYLLLWENWEIFPTCLLHKKLGSSWIATMRSGQAVSYLMPQPMTGQVTLRSAVFQVSINLAEGCICFFYPLFCFPRPISWSKNLKGQPINELSLFHPNLWMDHKPLILFGWVQFTVRGWDICFLNNIVAINVYPPQGWPDMESGFFYAQ